MMFLYKDKNGMRTPNVLTLIGLPIDELNLEYKSLELNLKKIYESTMRELKGLGLVHFERGYGYYMAVDKDVARAELNEAM